MELIDQSVCVCIRLKLTIYKICVHLYVIFRDAKGHRERVSCCMKSEKPLGDVYYPEVRAVQSQALGSDEGTGGTHTVTADLTRHGRQDRRKAC